jgi:hypothetical protein
MTETFYLIQDTGAQRGFGKSAQNRVQRSVSCSSTDAAKSGTMIS